MASPQSPVPAPRDATPELLTPRSKIKALLATVESSDEEGGQQVRKSTKSLFSRISPVTRKDDPQEEIDDGSDSDVPIRPRGKLASRMQGITATAEKPAATIITDTTESPTSETPRNEGERLVEQPRQTSGADGEDDDEDDDLPVAPRRLKQRVARSPSPGLFVSSPARPSPSKNGNHSGSEDDLPAVKSDRFKALVEKKRQERLAREEEEAARDAERRALQELDSDDDNVSSIADDEGGLKLTQSARPSRKAGKKAIEEMNRETQRMARNMQLSHEAKTRKKVTKASLFDRFNYKPAGESLVPAGAPINSSSSRPSPKSDADKEEDTPPSSPPVGEKQVAAQTEAGENIPMDDAEEEDLPTLAEVMSSSPPRIVDKGKGKMPAVEAPEISLHIKRRVRVRLPVPSSKRMQLDSDELEVTTTTRDKINAVFESVPLKRDQESHAIQALRALALVKSPGKDSRRKKKDQEGMTPGEFQLYLQQKAREQAKAERDKRLNMLKAQGVVFQSAEERERQIQEVEDILAKAREEGERIMQEENAAAKKKRKENGEVDPLAWDTSDDEDYQEGGPEEGSVIELSGSEEEDDDDDDEDEDEDMDDGGAEVANGAALLEMEALEPTLSDDEAEAGDAEELPPTMKRIRARKQATVLSDDEDEMAIEATPVSKTPAKKTPGISTSDPVAPTSALRSAKKTFIPGLPVQGPAGLGLTQIFAGTMDDSQMSQATGPTQSMMPDFSQFPDSNFSARMDEDGDGMVLDSQQDESLKETQGVKLNLSQTQMRGLDSLIPDDSPSRYSQSMIFTQDGGLQDYTPLKKRFVEPTQSTMDAGSVDQQGFTVPESPLILRGRLRRKMDMPQANDGSSSSTSSDHGQVFESTNTAFNILKDGARKEQNKQLLSDFNKKKSKAREMIEEQAEESEDEYAGLGGVDGEDSDDESNASVDAIIDDAAGNDIDERKLAAFFNDREREKDEKEIEKLYKDIASGMFRRKRGADYDLSDSDDDGEARRRMKRRQFAKMQKALFADERVKKIAEDPGNQAFLRTIEDQGSDDEIGFLDVVDAPGSQSEETTSRENSAPAEQRQLQARLNTQPKERASSGASAEGRLPAHLRRTKDGRKPSNLGEVRDTLSDLLDERHKSVVPATEAEPDSDEERLAPSEALENKQTSPRRNSSAVVDRMSRRRNPNSATSNRNQLAFTAPGASSTSSTFKVPALLRRATTNSSLISSTTSGSASASASSTNNKSTTNTNNGGFGAEAKIKKGAGKKSGVHGFTRDTERNARMQENERRREERKIKGAESRVGIVGGLLGRGSFE